MPALDAILNESLALMAAKSQRRSLKPASREDGAWLEIGGRRLLSFSCNDYYGLSHHPEVVAAACEATQKYGAGAGASRLVTGNHPLYAELEEKLARAKGCEAALVFGSGYLANIGTIPALVRAGDLIVGDKLSHACMIDGARLSGATFLRYAHNNMNHLRQLLETNRGEHANCLIMTEAVFSMDGDRAPLAEINALAAEFDAWVMVDGAHGTMRREQDDEMRRNRLIPSSSHPPILMGTLSKSLGAYGGYVCGSRTLIDYLQTSARSAIYSTGLPPSAIAAASKALDILMADAELAARPLVRARQFTALLDLPEAQSAIVPLIIGESKDALAAADKLMDAGFYAAAIRPPTVPENTARLRFAFSALHSEEQVEKLAECVKGEML